MIKIIMMIMLALSLQASSTKYDVVYKGMTLGEIEDLSTIKDLYLEAEVTNGIARFLLGEDKLVYYGKEKPAIKDAKFKRDKKMILYAFSQSLTERPKYKLYPINETKNITLTCEDKACEFIYYKNKNVNGKGKILFDVNNEFISISEEVSDFQIVRK